MAGKSEATVRTIPGEPPEALAARLTAESAQEGADDGDSGAEPPKRKRGRPKGSKTRKPRDYAAERARRAANKGGSVAEDPDDGGPSPEEMQAQLAQLVQQMVPLTYRLVGAVVNRKYPDNPYTIEEATELTAAMLPVAAKYGDGFQEYLPELMLAGVCVAQFAGRGELALPPGRDVTT